MKRISYIQKSILAIMTYALATGLGVSNMALSETKLSFATGFAGGSGQIGQTMEKLQSLVAK